MDLDHEQDLRTRFRIYFRNSVFWGAGTGFLIYIAIRFPWWAVLNVPDNGQREALVRPLEAMATILLATGISALVFSILGMSKKRRVFAVGYLIVVIVVPFVLVGASFFWAATTNPLPPSEYYDPLLTPIIGWLLASALSLVCLVPIGLLSAIVFLRLTHNRE